MSPVPSVNPSPSPAPAPVKANAFVAFFGSQAFHALYHAVLVSVIGFLSTNGLPAGDDWAKWVAGLGGAALGAVVGWLNGVAAVKKVGLFFLCFLLASTAGAWEVSGKPFGVNPQAHVYSLSIGGQQVSGVLMPTASLGFSVGSGTPAYGYTGGYDFLLASVKPSGSQVSVTPYFGIGGALNVDLADWIDSGLTQPVKASGGINVFGPEIMGMVPTASKTWNFKSGEVTTLVGLSAPFDLFEDSTIIKLF